MPSGFYYLARTCLVEGRALHTIGYDKAFAAHFKGAEDLFAFCSAIARGLLAKMAIAKFTDAGEGGRSTRWAAGRNLMGQRRSACESRNGASGAANKWIARAGDVAFGAMAFNPGACAWARMAAGTAAP